MKETKNTLNHQEFLKVKNNPPCKLNMKIDILLRDRYNNNSYNLYQRNLLAQPNEKGCGSKSKNLLNKMWKEESKEIKKFFRILAIEGNRRFRLRNPKSPSTQPPSQPPKKKFPLLLPRPPLTQPHVYYQPKFEYYQPQPLPSPDEYYNMHKLSDELCQPQPQPQLQPQLHPQLSTILPQPLPQQYANCQPLSHEDNQFPEFYLPPLPELFLNNEHEQPQSPLFDVYFNW
ncbi:hypothetical protein C1646_670102 [Rhizophagus diaphanus]|nr:hypothetical protein C1646_670102 [Rhizophagus diaphanus] [Rhizophagus sp. MUCL 43196]